MMIFFLALMKRTMDPLEAELSVNNRSGTSDARKAEGIKGPLGSAIDDNHVHDVLFPRKASGTAESRQHYLYSQAQMAPFNS